MHLIAVLAGVRSLFRQRRRARSVRPVAAAGAGAARDSGIPRALDVLPVGRGHGRRQAGADPIGAQDDFEDGADGADGYDADGYGAEEYDADGDDADEYGGYEADDAAEAAADAPEAEDPDQVDTDLQQPPPAQRGRHMPSPRQRKQLREVSRILDGETERLNIARTTTEAAGALVEADVAALVVRSVEGPRVLWQDPGGSEPDDIWGPATLAALLTVGSPVREVIEGDPLIDYGSSALLVVPVPSAGTLVGALMARRQTPRSFSPAEEDALLRLARMAGAALDADSRRGHLDPSSGTDPVTRFWPRERLLHDLRAALRGTQQHSMPAALLLAEVTGLAERRRAAGPEAADRALAGWPPGCRAACGSGTSRTGSVTTSSRCCCRAPSPRMPARWPTGCGTT